MKTTLVFNYNCIFVHPKNKMAQRSTEAFLTFIAVTFKTPPSTEANTKTKGISGCIFFRKEH